MSVESSLAEWANTYPDGGYGWIIVLGGFMCNFIVDGTCYSYGLLLNDFKNEFGASTFQAAMAGSLCQGCYLIMGPVSSALENQYGARGITVLGSIMASVGFILSTIAPSINYFILCWGVIGGCGFGLVYLPSIVVASHWFQAKRGTAMGFIVSGSGVGASVMSKVVVFLFSRYDWRGVVWIIVGLILNMVAMGTLFRPIRSADFRVMKKDEDDDSIHVDHTPTVRTTHIGNRGSYNDDMPGTFYGGSQGNMLQYPGSQHVPDSVSPSPPVTMNGYGAQVGSIYEVSHLWDTHEEYYGQQNTNRSRTQIAQPQGGGGGRYIRTGVPREGNTRRSTFRIDTFRASNLDLRNRVVSERNLSPGRSRHTVYSNDGYYSIPDVTQYESVKNGEGGDEEEDNLKDAVLGPLKEMLDFSLLKRKSFSLLVFATVCTMMALFIPFVYLASYAEQEANVLLSESSTLMVILGLSNTFGRLLAGFLSDNPWVDPLMMNNVALMIAGAFTMFVPLFKSYYLLVGYVIVFGCGVATFVCLRTIILDNIFGIEYLNNSFGIMLLFHGLAAVVGSPAAGMLFDYTGSYTYTFVVSGGLMTFSGAICLPLRQLAKWEQSTMNRAAEAEAAEQKRKEQRGQQQHRGALQEGEGEDDQAVYTASSLYRVDEFETVL
ncbi:monocarboxylate transporter 9-like isoform X2 [Symsagittifera roscoffensis]|uniref:monocarboxylate transporter 9-like isoform X2 n=1 Tax=Symsagittifera roscoffensis TaxID=84072 RepID=UPI00307C9035